MIVVREDQVARYAREPKLPPPASFAHLEATGRGDVFPHDLLEGCGSALCLFSAAFWGRQDVLWLALAGITGTCVDRDGEKLEEMRKFYPAGWEFVEADCFDHAATVGADAVDVVTVDCWSNQFQECADLAPEWTRIARRLVLIASGVDTKTEAPDGWQALPRMLRSSYLGGIYWTILVPA